MAIVERYNTPVSHAYRILKHEDKENDGELALQMVKKAGNDTVGPEGLIITLLLDITLPQTELAANKSAASTFQRAASMHKASRELHKIFSRRQVQDALRQDNRLSVTNVNHVTIGGHVLVYRSQHDKWEGLYALMDIEEGDLAFLMPHGVSNSRSKNVKSFH